MRIVPFVAESAAEAIERIRAELGPDAVVLNVRKLPAEGFAKLWRGPRIEVLACLPEAAQQQPDAIEELRKEVARIKQQLVVAPAPPTPAATPRRWRAGTVLESVGLLPIHAQKVVEWMQLSHGPTPPEPLAEELALAREALAQLWDRPERDDRRFISRTHVFVGAPGVGKTTCLCKWLVQASLIENQLARVWRLDGPTANTAGLVDLYGEILDVPVSRTPDGSQASDEEALFVDLPGVPVSDSSALDEIASRLATFREPQVHLVLNAAYETPLLLAQVGFFSAIAVTDLIVTHLDEESRWAKLWNLVLGTNYTLRFLSAGQNIPGEFTPATAEALLARIFPSKAALDRVRTV